MTDTASTHNPLTTPPIPSPDEGAPTEPPSNGVRRAWMAIGSLAAAGIVVFGTFAVVDVLAHEQTTDVTTHEAVSQVSIDGDEGSVRVRTDEVTEITVTAMISEGLRDTAVHQAIEGDVLVLRSSCPNVGGTWCSVDWDVIVPVGTDLRVRSDGDRTEAAGEFGTVDLRSEDDGVTFDGVARTVVAESEHAGVTVRLGEPADSVRAISDHGNVRVVVPDIDDGYRVEVSSGHGSTAVDVRTDPDAVRSIEARSDHGSVVVGATP
jgi:hypothetical protein